MTLLLQHQHHHSNCNDSNTRCLDVLRLSALLGNLAQLFLQYVPPVVDFRDASAETTSSFRALALPMAAILVGLQETAHHARIHLEQAIRNKIVLNGRKYPVEHAKVGIDRGFMV